jgi:hypothetical protein
VNITRIFQATAIGIAISYGSAAGQLVRTAPVILSLPVSTAAVSMGGAYPLMSAHSDIVFYNPARARSTNGPLLTHVRYGDAANLTSFVAGTALNLTFGVQVLDYGTNGASAAAALDERELPVGGDLRAGEFEGVLGYATTIYGVRVGGAAKWVQHWSDSDGDGIAAFDVGVTTNNPLRGLSVGFAVQNIGDDVVADGSEYHLPRRESLMLATTSHELSILDFEVSGELHTIREKNLGGGLGIELSYWPFSGLTFMGRGGARFGNDPLAIPGRSEAVKHSVPTAGAGIAYKHFTLDYAWEPFAGAADAHHFTLRVN